MKQLKKTENPLLKECFFTALIRLMDHKDFKDITISEISQVAGVSRMTYYRTYSSKEDILLQYFDDRANQFIEEIKAQPEISAEKFCILFFQSFQSNAHLLKYLYQADLINGILDRFIEFIHILFCELGPFPSNDPAIQHRVHFIAGGIHIMLVQWIKSGQKESAEEMAKTTMSILCSPLISA